MDPLELGIYSFAETTQDPVTGQRADTAQRLRDLLEEIVLADQVDLDVSGVGEHHRPDFAVSTPAIVLAAAAARTQRIRLTSRRGSRRSSSATDARGRRRGTIRPVRA